MNDISITILTGVVSSILGAFIVYAAAGAGLSFRKQKRDRIKKKKEDEINQLCSSNYAERQSVTNEYIFIVLRYLMLANIFWVVPNIFSIDEIDLPTIYYWPFNALTLIAFYIGLGKASYYLKLKSEAQEILLKNPNN